MNTAERQTPPPPPPAGGGGNPPPAAPRRRRASGKAFLAAFLAAVLLVFGAAVWLVSSTRGLAAACSLAAAASGGRLVLVPAGGRLLGPLQLREARWQDGAGRRLEIRELDLDWSPRALQEGRLEIARLRLGTLRFALPPSTEPAQPPPSLRLPLAVALARLEIGRLEKNDGLLAENLAGSLASDGVRHRLSALQARSGEVELNGEAEIGGDAPFPLAARLRAESRVQGRPFRLALQAEGPLAAIAVTGAAEGALHGSLAARLAPFAVQPIGRLQLHLRGVEPAAWASGAPAAHLDIDADLEPRLGEEVAVGGTFAVRNHRPGRLDAGALPLARLSGRVDWRGENADFADFADFAATLSGGGRLAGHGQLAGKHLTLALQAQDIDAAALHSRLRPTRLRGPLNLALDPAGQSLQAELADRQFSLAARLSHRDGQIEVADLRLAAGTARLQADGRLALDAAYRFEARGRLEHFDPGRFARQLPAGDINAGFAAAGTLQPHPAAALRFELGESRIQGHPLRGSGEVELDWPLLKKAELSIDAGRNRLRARGAFGRPGDALAIDIDAPQLAPYGIEGSVRGKIVLGGTPAAPTLDGRLQAPSLGLTGLGRVLGLSLLAEAEAPPAGKAQVEAPLRLDLRLDSLDTPTQAGAARGVSLRIDGSRGRHRLRAAATLAGERHIVLAAAGGLGEEAGTPAWNGRLEGFDLTAGGPPAAANAKAAAPPPHPEFDLHLLQAAPLRVGAAQWAIGPAEVGGRQWRGRLQAQAGDGRLRASVQGEGRPYGRVAGEVEARLLGAWQLARADPWRGRLTLDLPDLAWLGALLGEGWQTAGRLAGELQLAGTPEKPQASGRFDGERLGLRLPEQDLHLEQGRLQATLAENRLHLAALSFASPLRPPPRELLAARRADPEAGPDPARLAAAAGRLEIGGEVNLGALAAPAAPGGEKAFFDVRLERLGVFQQPDQWLAVSGHARLGWNNGSLAARGRLVVDAGYWELAPPGAPQLSDDVIVKTHAPGKPAAARPKLDLDIEADFGPGFYFRGAGLASRLAGSVRLKAAGRDLPRAGGSIRTVGGKFDAYGQQLDIERGILNFQGLIDNPGLNVRALRPGLPLEVGVVVGGTVKKPAVRLVSDPELPEAEKLSWLVLGHGSEQMGSRDASVLLAAAGELFGKDGGKSGGGVMQQLQRQLGIEEFGLRRGQVGEAGGRQATSRIAGGGGFDPGATAGGSQIVTVGKRLSSNVMLSYEQALGKTENLVKLTVNLTRRLSLVGRTGSDNALDFFYTFRFGK